MYKNFRRDPLIINVHNQAKLQVWLPGFLTQAWLKPALFPSLGSCRGSPFFGEKMEGERGDGKCNLKILGRQTENRAEFQQKAVITLKWMAFCSTERGITVESFGGFQEHSSDLQFTFAVDNKCPFTFCFVYPDGLPTRDAIF